MSWHEDGSDELDAAVKAIKSESKELIADRLEKWAKNGVNIEWGDFLERAVLETAVKYLRESDNSGSTNNSNNTTK